MTEPPCPSRSGEIPVVLLLPHSQSKLAQTRPVVVAAARWSRPRLQERQQTKQISTGKPPVEEEAVTLHMHFMSSYIHKAGLHYVYDKTNLTWITALDFTTELKQRLKNGSKSGAAPACIYTCWSYIMNDCTLPVVHWATDTTTPAEEPAAACFLEDTEFFHQEKTCLTIQHLRTVALDCITTSCVDSFSPVVKHRGCCVELICCM